MECSTVSVFGSCTTRDLFYSKVIPNYKQYFKLTFDSQRSTIISVMQKPIDFSEEDIDTGNVFSTASIKKDLNKNFRANLIINPPEYLIFDLDFDMLFGVLLLNNGGGIISNNFWDLPKTEFYKNLNGEFKTLTIQDTPKEYFSLFKENIESFFNFLDKNCPETTVILNSIRHSWNVLRLDKSVSEEASLKKNCQIRNKNIEKLEEFIIDNFNVEVMYFGKEYLADESNMWGLASHHYEQKYYQDKFNQLKKIVMNNKIRKKNAFLLEDMSQLKEENKQLSKDIRILTDKLCYFQNKK